MSDEWNTYRTKFLVRAQQLAEPMTFTDVLGREHHGEAGDYLVQSPHGLRVAPREVFEDVMFFSTLTSPNFPAPQTRF